MCNLSGGAASGGFDCSDYAVGVVGCCLLGSLCARADSRAGQYSIRIDQQWRICFQWTDAGPEDVEITDYH